MTPGSNRMPSKSSSVKWLISSPPQHCIAFSTMGRRRSVMNWGSLANSCNAMCTARARSSRTGSSRDDGDCDCCGCCGCVVEEEEEGNVLVGGREGAGRKIVVLVAAGFDADDDDLSPYALVPERCADDDGCCCGSCWCDSCCCGDKVDPLLMARLSYVASLDRSSTIVSVSIFDWPSTALFFACDEGHGKGHGNGHVNAMVTVIMTIMMTVINDGN